MPFFKKFIFSLAALFLPFSFISSTEQLSDDAPEIERSVRAFGGWSIGKELFDYIRSVVPDEQVILELGSGWSSEELSKHYTVYSIEHNQEWVGKYNTNYIFAPIKNGWYDLKILKKSLPKAYNLILIDGPTPAPRRLGFYHNLKLFNTDVTLVFDDVDRSPMKEMLIQLAEQLGRPYEIRQSGNKQFGIIPGV